MLVNALVFVVEEEFVEVVDLVVLVDVEAAACAAAATEVDVSPSPSPAPPLGLTCASALRAASPSGEALLEASP